MTDTHFSRSGSSPPNPIIWRELQRRTNGNPRALAMWEVYVAFIKTAPVIPPHVSGTAVHHILWRAEYPQFTKSKWNLVRLTNEDHTAAAALMLAAEPTNAALIRGHAATLKLAAINLNLAWRPENPEHIVHLYQIKRWTATKIGEKHGVSAGIVRAFLRRNGVSFRTSAEAQLWEPEERHRSAVIHLYIVKKWTSERIGKKYDACGSSIVKFLKRNGVTIRPRGGIHPPWEPSNRAEAIRLYREGKSASALADKYGVSDCTIQKFLKRNGVQLHEKGHFHRWEPKEPKDVIHLYQDLKWAAHRIGKKYGVSAQTVIVFYVETEPSQYAAKMSGSASADTRSQSNFQTYRRFNDTHY